MTRSSHNEWMVRTQISKLKSRLSFYLKKVRSGELVVVLDRETPIAQIISIQPQIFFEIRKATKKVPSIGSEIKLRKNIDIVAFLREDRDAR